VSATTINFGPIGIGTTPIAAGNLILIIQMQGTEISTANSNNYGDNVAGAPASGYLTNVNHLSGNKAITIQLTDMTGRVVLPKTDRASGGQYPLTVPVSLKGMYLLKVSGGSAVYQQKLVIE
jgi:hypothetical protein